MQNVEKLRAKIKKAMNNWNERGPIVVDREKLSKADVDMILLYCSAYERVQGINSLMKPRGGVAEVLSKNGIIWGEE